MEDFGVQFAFRDAGRLEALRALFAELKRDKEIEDFRDPEEWKAFMPPEVLASFDWPSDGAAGHSTSIAGQWDFDSVFDALETGEYLLLDVVETDPEAAELRIDPLAYPYGGLGPFIALVEAFGFEVLGVNSYGRFQPRAELLRSEEEGPDGR